MIWLISGIPGAGKTTVSRLLAERLERSAWIEGDLIGHHFIIRGLVPPDAEPADEAERHRDANRHKQVFHLWSHLDAQMRSWPEPRPGLWLDSSDLTAEQTVDEILRREEEALA